MRFGLRDYDPAAGRFTAKDPSFFEGSPGNLYGYAGSDPISMRDPTGLFCIGATLYDGIGGGGQYCRKNGKSSICAEVGVGVGGGVEVDPFGDAQKDSFAHAGRDRRPSGARSRRASAASSTSTA